MLDRKTSRFAGVILLFLDIGLDMRVPEDHNQRLPLSRSRVNEKGVFLYPPAYVFPINAQTRYEVVPTGMRILDDCVLQLQVCDR